MIMILRPECRHEVAPGVWIAWDAVLSDDDPALVGMEQLATERLDKIIDECFEDDG